MKKSGFTLIEIIITIAILGILLGLAGFSMTSIMERTRGDSAELMSKNLADAAVTYGLAEIFLKKCPVGFQITESALANSAVLNRNNSCFKKVKVSLLEEKGYFTDEGNRCSNDLDVYIYNYVEKDNDAGEYTAYVPAEICN